MTDDAAELHALVAAAYDRHHKRPRVSPEWLATEVMADLKFQREDNRLVYLAAHLELRQIARGLCRVKYEDDGQGELFKGVLQHRYPCAGSSRDNPEYVLRDLMTHADVGFNVARLRAEADAKSKHADALEDWWRKRSAVA